MVTCDLLQGDSGARLDSALEATVDSHEWRLEVERVLPSLKIHFRQDNRVSPSLTPPNTCILI